MIPRPLIRLGAVVLLASSAAFATACSASPPSAAPTDSAAPAPSSPSPTPDATSDPDTAGADADPQCDTIIPASLVNQFKGLGWSANAEPFRINGVPIEGGLQCTWGDLTVASDHVQIFGWAPITAETADTSRTELLASGWRREDGPEGIYITESASTAITTDGQGYGLTYLFGDGWVKYADTKQGLLLVTWPPA